MTPPAQHGSPSPAAPDVGNGDAVIGCVVIGRNEGDRLRACFRALGAESVPLVYVDSGSTDSSLRVAREFGATVVELDSSRPFTAARARNAGLERLVQVAPGTEYVQFIDGDCELVSGWLEVATEKLRSDLSVAVVSGRIRERHPERSVFNQLCDLEWDTPVGVVQSCGGNAMMRVDALAAVGGFNPTLIAGEEPDLCQRLRSAGGRILKLPAEMVLHDADLLSYAQWWKRSLRWGYAAAQLAHLHSYSDSADRWRTVSSSAMWALGLPVVVLAVSSKTPLGALLLAAYPARIIRLYSRRRRQHREDPKRALAYALLNTADKFSELLGATRYAYALLTGRYARLIEHKRVQKR